MAKLVPTLPDRSTGSTLVMYVIYRNPIDYPDQFVVRKQAAILGEVYAETEPKAVVSTLELARGMVPRGLVALARDPRDEPQIVETWI